MQPRAPRRDAGQATTAILCVVSLLLLGLGLTYHVRLSKAADQAGGLKGAADAAALAGAQSIRDLSWGKIMSAIHAGKELDGDLGEDAAREFASRNGANLVSYVYRPAADLIEVTVESKSPLESGQVERRVSKASAGAQIARCIVQDGFNWELILGIKATVPVRCGELDFDVEADGESKQYKHVLNHGQWKKLFGKKFAEPYLTEEIRSPIGASAPPGTFVPPMGIPAAEVPKDWAERGRSWTNIGLFYSQSNWHTNEYGRYRQDCSGFVSLMWDLKDSLTTATLPSVSHPISKDELRPGDILNSVSGGHVLLFAGWANAERTMYWSFEMTPPNAVYHQVEYPYWHSSSSGASSYIPMRKNGATP